RARHLIDIVLHGRPDKGMTAQPPEPVRRAFQLLRSMSVDEVADGLGFSSRHLRRLVVEHSGLGPKTYQRVVRLRHFLADDGPLAQAATNAVTPTRHTSRERSPASAACHRLRFAQNVLDDTCPEQAPEGAS